MYELAKLCHRIQMPQAVTNIVLFRERGDESLGFRTARQISGGIFHSVEATLIEDPFL